MSKNKKQNSTVFKKRNPVANYLAHHKNGAGVHLDRKKQSKIASKRHLKHKGGKFKQQ